MIGSQLVENTGSFFKLITFEEGVILTIHYIILLTLRNSINKPTREGSQTHRVHQTNWRWKPSLAVAKCQNSLSSGKKRRQNDIKRSGWAQRNGQFVLVDWRQVNPFALKLNLRDSPLVSRRKIWKVKQLKFKPVHTWLTGASLFLPSRFKDRQFSRRVERADVCPSDCGS